MMCLLAFSCLKSFCLTALISFQSSLLGTMRTVRDKILCPTPSKTLMVLLFADVTLKDYQIPVCTRTSHKYFGVQDLRIVFLSEISICLTVKAAAFTSDCSAVVWKSQHVCVYLLFLGSITWIYCVHTAAVAVAADRRWCAFSSYQRKNAGCVCTTLCLFLRQGENKVRWFFLVLTHVFEYYVSIGK